MNANLKNVYPLTMNYERVTPEVAHKWLQMSVINRPIQKKMIDRYAHDMESGRWLLSGEAIKFDTAGHLADGQHRLLAIIRTSNPMNMAVVRGVDPVSFTVMDSGRSRSLSDVLALQGHRGYATVLSAMLRQMWFYRNGCFNGTSVGTKSVKGPTNTDLLVFLEDEPEIACVAKIENSTSKRNVLMTATLRGTLRMLFTEKGGEDQASEFMDGFLLGSDLEEDHPVLKLRNRLIKEVASRDRMGPEEKAALTIKAWNAVRRNQRINILKYVLYGRTSESFPEIV